MTKRRVYSDVPYAHFVTFSCYKRRQLLHPDRSKKIVVGILAQELSKHDGRCLGFVVMPNHVHALVWFADASAISPFMNKWKDRSSHRIKTLFREHYPNYWRKVDQEDSVWQAKYYDFNVYSSQKVHQKLDYMHANSVRARLVERTTDWQWSSARWYLPGRSVGVPIRAPEGAFS